MHTWRDGDQQSRFQRSDDSSVVLDTDILSEYLKGYDSVVAGHAAQYAGYYGVFSLTSVTVYEIVYGLHLKDARAQLGRVLAWLAKNEIITPIGEDYIEAAMIRANAAKQGAILDLPDCLIAQSRFGLSGLS